MNEPCSLARLLSDLFSSPCWCPLKGDRVLLFVLSESYLRSDSLFQGRDLAWLAPRSVLVSATICRALVCFELILLYSMKWESNHILFSCRLELRILLPLPPKCWDYRDMSSRRVWETEVWIHSLVCARQALCQLSLIPKFRFSLFKDKGQTL